MTKGLEHNFQLLLTLAEHMISPKISAGIVLRNIDFCVVYLLSYSPASFHHCVVCPSIYPFGIFKLFLHICLKISTPNSPLHHTAILRNITYIVSEVLFLQETPISYLNKTKKELKQHRYLT